MVASHLETARRRVKGKRVVITGDTGFKGSWLSLWLHLAGAEVFGYALPPENAQSHFSQLELQKVIRHEDGDVRDAEHLSRFMQESRPEIVFHLAAQALVRRSYADPKTTYDTNIGGAVNLMEAVKQTESIRALVFVTSDKCYKNLEVSHGYRETDELGGRDPYSASKAAAELVFSSFFESFLSKRANFGAATVRAGNVIGGGDWA
ncbi:MAG: CDP-glucose 4,6-dehydratase, partial [Actinobacteria bacterium]|nr:CDP-glucose 4,6-dehydratase [Actinomycetota bacterium]